MTTQDQLRQNLWASFRELLLAQDPDLADIAPIQWRELDPDTQALWDGLTKTLCAGLATRLHDRKLSH